MTVAGEGRNPDHSHMRKLAEQADVTKREADAIIDEVQTPLAHWPDHAADAGVGKVTAEQIAQSLPRGP